jgi:hemerythrin
MASMMWHESYSVGVKILDQQHKGLMDLVNQLSDLDPNVVSKGEIFSTLNALVKYAQMHFDTEELLMAKFKYPKLTEHQAEHTTFTTDVFKLAEKLEKNDPNIQRKIVDFIKIWYVSHILKTDREYKDFFKANGVE